MLKTLDEQFPSYETEKNLIANFKTVKFSIEEED